jgi:hypothetical protein
MFYSEVKSTECSVRCTIAVKFNRNLLLAHLHSIALPTGKREHEHRHKISSVQHERINPKNIAQLQLAIRNSNGRSGSGTKRSLIVVAKRILQRGVRDSTEPRFSTSPPKHASEKSGGSTISIRFGCSHAKSTRRRSNGTVHQQ